MLLLYFVVLAIPIGYLLDGSLKNYANRPLRLVFLPCAAFLIEACFGVIGKVTGYTPEQWLPWAVGIEYLLLAVFILSNLSRKGVKLLGIATVLNFAVISANGFRMPVTPLAYDNPAMATLVQRVQSGDLPEYVMVDWDGPLWFLGDTIPMGGGLASIGDLLMAVGVLLLIVDLMCSKPRPARRPRRQDYDDDDFDDYDD